ncbi:hypothetical protein [Streptomyces sp. NPDC002215]|uniref:hypothetical protein n=1 Tax=Streptomyces sp. NPDC002215 TaxID=3154412 RepID=UPI003318FFC9
MSPTPPPAGPPSRAAAPAGSTPGRVPGSTPGRVADSIPSADSIPFAGPVSVPTASPTSIPLATAASIPVFTAHARPPSPSHPPSPGRTRHGFALGLVAASVVLGGTSVATASAESSATPVSSPGSATADQQPACGDPEAKDFPISTRIHGGPDMYASGGGYGTWFLDLTNITTESCRGIHPVLVLTDEDRRLTADQIQLKFSEQGSPGTEHRVTWETTDQDEHIGVFGGEGGDSFDGFTVPAGRTVTVQVRMAFTSDTSPGRMTVNAAIVQRQRAASGTAGKAGKDDGAWVGESEEYPFTVVVDESDGEEASDTADTADIDEMAGTTETGETPEIGVTPETGDVPEIGETPEIGDAPETSETAGTGEVGGTGDTPREPRPVGPGRTPEQSGRLELAETGSGSVPAAGITVTGLLIGGGAMVIRARRSRRANP